MKKVFAVLVALTLVLSCAVMAFAAETPAVATGTITVTNAIDGETYTLYRIFDLESYDATAGTYSYKINAAWEAFATQASAYFTVDANGYIDWKKSLDNNSEDVKAFAALAIKFAEDNKIASVDSDEASNGTVTFNDLALGYYLIDTSLGTLCAITTTNPDAEVTEKNEGPTLEKKIVEGEDLVDANNVKIGDTVTYQATITVGKGAVNYVMHDKMSTGLDYVGVTSVTVDGVDVGDANYEVIVNTDDDCTFEIEFEDAYITALAKDTEIVVTYTATLNADAVVGEEGNPNEAWLEYGDAQKTTHDFVITYTTSLTINKVDADNKALKGAGFTLYKGKGDAKEAIGEEIKGDDITTFVWTGLKAGDYTLVETTVPDGYNKADDIEFTITWTAPTTVDAGTEDATWTSSTAKITVENGLFKGEIVNKTGSLLPETGGIGTTIFYVVGGLLMVCALVVLVSKKRMASFA